MKFIMGSVEPTAQVAARLIDCTPPRRDMAHEDGVLLAVNHCVMRCGYLRVTLRVMRCDAMSDDERYDVRVVVRLS